MKVQYKDNNSLCCLGILIPRGRGRSWMYNYLYNQCLSPPNLDEGEVYNIM
jgi:hypothetical protein